MQSSYLKVFLYNLPALTYSSCSLPVIYKGYEAEGPLILLGHSHSTAVPWQPVLPPRDGSCCNSVAQGELPV